MGPVRLALCYATVAIIFVCNYVHTHVVYIASYVIATVVY